MQMSLRMNLQKFKVWIYLFLLMWHKVNFSVEYCWFWIQSLCSIPVSIPRLKNLVWPTILLMAEWIIGRFMSFPRALAQSETHPVFELRSLCPFSKMITIIQSCKICNVCILRRWAWLVGNRTHDRWRITW